MRIALTARFVRDVDGLSDDRRLAVRAALRALPDIVGRPHLHAGVGLRKIHPSGIWEARAGLGIRIVLAIEGDLATLVRAGTHDRIRRYLKSL